MAVAVIAVAAAERAAVRAAAAVSHPILWDVIVKTGQVREQVPPFK